MLRPRGSSSVDVFASAPGDGLHLSCVRPLVVYPAPCPVRIRPPAPGDDWIHEPKWDGFRFQIIKDRASVRFYSRHGAEYTERLPGMAEAFAKLSTESAILDGELVLIDPRGAAHFYRLMREMRTSHPDESQLMILAFDLLHQDGVDLRALPLSERKKDLRRLCLKSKVPFLKQVETFPDGAVLLEWCNRYGFEGVVSKRLSSRYMSGPSRHWTKSKCPGWKRENAERYRLFERPKKAEPSEQELRERELKKKRAELARVLESLRGRDLWPGLARELRKHVAILEQELAEIERA